MTLSRSSTVSDIGIGHFQYGSVCFLFCAIVLAQLTPDVGVQ